MRAHSSPEPSQSLPGPGQCNGSTAAVQKQGSPAPGSRAAALPDPDWWGSSRTPQSQVAGQWQHSSSPHRPQLAGQQQHSLALGGGAAAALPSTGRWSSGSAVAAHHSPRRRGSSRTPRPQAAWQWQCIGSTPRPWAVGRRQHSGSAPRPRAAGQQQCSSSASWPQVAGQRQCSLGGWAVAGQHHLCLLGPSEQLHQARSPRHRQACRCAPARCHAAPGAGHQPSW